MRSELYPAIEPHRTGYLKLDDLHDMYWEECGNPNGVPVVFIHGGPGAGADASARRFFDPDYYRIVVYDQRGAGRSNPLGETRENTTPHLIADLEKLRTLLGMDRWIVFGGSWGSTLGIAYAEHHPDRCLGLILRGIFLCRREEIDWFMYGMKTIFPEEWRTFSEFICESERDNLAAAYHKLLMSTDREVYMPAALSWSRYEGACATLMPSPETVTTFLDDTVALGLARMESYYFTNNIFLPDNFLFENLYLIRHIPTIIVQGRYDIVCPIITADLVAKELPEADYRIVPNAGHSASEPALCAELVRACEAFKSLG
ncbi:prolyl aminopeptidase [Candidatus Paracaedibacter symbiosus]|uniref:prolyl aminopeptidase n=1 Tax=Candidatus Paracaedibacter symbiosus TaxID=244582 RepID=UPI000509D4AE|nr:prolyl aminopeptidase [Candidatus Paracaedibacter symbiosus]